MPISQLFKNGLTTQNTQSISKTRLFFASKKKKNQKFSPHQTPFVIMKAAVFVLALIVALIAVVTAVPVEYTDCAPGSLITLKGFDATMWPPQKEAEFTMTTTGIATQAVTEGEWTVTSSWAGMVVDKQTGPLANWGDVSLPIQQGQIVIKNSGVMPGNAPAGAYTMTTKAVTASGQDIFCYKMTFKL